jgi:hypothetical protein
LFKYFTISSLHVFKSLFDVALATIDYRIRKGEDSESMRPFRLLSFNKGLPCASDDLRPTEYAVLAY